MADITLSTRMGIAPYRSRAGSPLILTRDASTCASTATIKLGQVVQLDIVTETASHRLVRASTVAGHPNLSTNYLGVAAKADTSDGSTTGFGAGKRQLQVWAADWDTEFLFPSKLVTASTHVGTAMVLGFDSTLGIHYLTTNSTAGDARVFCTEIPNPGDTNGFVVGRFIQANVSPAVGLR